MENWWRFSNPDLQNANWLLGDLHDRILPSVLTLSRDAIVSSFIDPYTRWWNLAIVDLNFLPFWKAFSAQENLFLWVQSGELLMVLKSGFTMLTGYMETYMAEYFQPSQLYLKMLLFLVSLIQIQDGGTRLLLIWISCLLKLKKSRQYLYVQLYNQITCTGPIAEMVHMWLNLAISYYVKKKIEIQLSNSDAIISFWRIIWTSK